MAEASLCMDGGDVISATAARIDCYRQPDTCPLLAKDLVSPPKSGVSDWFCKDIKRWQWCTCEGMFGILTYFHPSMEPKA